MKLTLSKSLINGCLSTISATIASSLPLVPEFQKVVGEKVQSKVKDFPMLSFDAIPTSKEDSGVRFIKNEDELVIEINDMLIEDVLKSSLVGFNYTLKGALELLKASKAVVFAQNEVQEKWDKVKGFEYLPVEPFKYMYLNHNGDMVNMSEETHTAIVDSFKEYAKLPKEELDKKLSHLSSVHKVPLNVVKHIASNIPTV